MKKPLFDEIGRLIMHEDNSSAASLMKMQIEIKKFERDFMKKIVVPYFNKIAALLNQIEVWFKKK